MSDSEIDRLYRAGAGALAESLAWAMDTGKRLIGKIVSAIRSKFTTESGAKIPYETARNVARKAFRAVDAGARLNDQRDKIIPANRLPIDPTLPRDGPDNFAYKVVVELTDPDTGDSVRGVVRVLTQKPIRGEDIVNAAQDLLIDGPPGGPPSKSTKLPTPEWKLTYSAIIYAARKE